MVDELTVVPIVVAHAVALLISSADAARAMPLCVRRCNNSRLNGPELAALIALRINRVAGMCSAPEDTDDVSGLTVAGLGLAGFDVLRNLEAS